MMSRRIESWLPGQSRVERVTAQLGHLKQKMDRLTLLSHRPSGVTLLGVAEPFKRIVGVRLCAQAESELVFRAWRSGVTPSFPEPPRHLRVPNGQVA